jgi:hypothetical protein
MLDFTEGRRLDPQYAHVSQHSDVLTGSMWEITVGKMGRDQTCLCRPVICDFMASQYLNQVERKC